MKQLLTILLSTISVLSLNADIDLGPSHPKSVFQEDKVVFIDKWETHYSNKGIVDLWKKDKTTYLKVAMALFRLRPVLYYQVAWDEGDYYDTGMFKKNFKSVQEMLAISDSSSFPPREEPRHHFEFYKGKQVAIFLPKVAYNDRAERLKRIKWIPDDYAPAWRSEYNGREKQQQWQWNDIKDLLYSNIPINYFDTSVNKEPLHVNLWEHPKRKEFYNSVYPSSALFDFSAHSHVVEADLLEFTDIVKSINGDTIDFLTTNIHARIVLDEENLQNLDVWSINDLINLVYIKNGIYEAWNRTKNECFLRVYISDSIYSDLRNFEITKEEGI